MIIICFSCKAHFSTSKTPPYFDTLMAWLNQSKCYRALCFKVEKVLEKVGSEKVIVFESCPESVLDEVWLGRRRSRYRAATVVGAGWWTGQNWNWARVVHRILLKSQVGLLSTVNIYCLIFLGKSNTVRPRFKRNPDWRDKKWLTGYFYFIKPLFKKKPYLREWIFQINWFFLHFF